MIRKQDKITILVLVASIGALLRVTSAEAQEIGYTLSLGAGTAMAMGGDLAVALADYGLTVGADASYAPVLGAALSFDLDFRLKGALRATAGLELRRLGYAFWAPDADAMSWLATWLFGLRAGVLYPLGPWTVGGGLVLDFPVGSMKQESVQGGTGLSVGYDTGGGRFVVPGLYLRGDLGLGGPRPWGDLLYSPALGLEAGLWPGLVNDVATWQTAFSLVLSFDIHRRPAR